MSTWGGWRHCYMKDALNLLLTHRFLTSIAAQSDAVLDPNIARRSQENGGSNSTQYEGHSQWRCISQESHVAAIR